MFRLALRYLDQFSTCVFQLNVDRKDTLIDFVGVELVHEDGSAHCFEWAGMSEFFSEVKNNKGESNIVQRDIVPISIKLSTLSIVERFFRFQETSFIEENKAMLDDLMEYNTLLKKNHHPNYPDEFFVSENFFGGRRVSILCLSYLVLPKE